MQRYSIPHMIMKSISSVNILLDSCDVKNGGCGKYADCCHDPKTNEVVCKCKTGYTNVGKDGKTECKGNHSCSYVSSIFHFQFI